MNAFIYAIRNETSDAVYIGSTTLELRMRWSQHRYCGGCRSAEIVKCHTAYMEYIEGCDIDKRIEREQYWIDNTPHCVNLANPGHKWSVEKARKYSMNWANANRDRYREINKAACERYRARRKAANLLMGT